MSNLDQDTGSSRMGLSRLKELCTQLTDRDVQIKKDLQLFDSFFDNFPIPVTMWSVNKDHIVLSHRGECFTKQEATTLEELFNCPIVKKLTIEKHATALNGNVCTYVLQVENNLYWTKLIPMHSGHEVSGVIGIALDITSNAIILASLEKIEEKCQDDACIKEIHEVAVNAIQHSKLKKILQDLED